MDIFGNLLKTAQDAGSQLLTAEIANHGGQQPETRPDPATVPATVNANPGSVAKSGMDKKTMIYIGAGVGIGVLVLALLLKK